MLVIVVFTISTRQPLPVPLSSQVTVRLLLTVYRLHPLQLSVQLQLALPQLAQPPIQKTDQPTQPRDYETAAQRDGVAGGGVKGCISIMEFKAMCVYLRTV